MTEPTAIQPILQRGVCTCAVASLAMLLGVSETAVLEACPRRRNVHAVGMSVRQIVATAKRLSVRLVVRTRFDLDEDLRRRQGAHLD